MGAARARAASASGAARGGLLSGHREAASVIERSHLAANRTRLVALFRLLDTTADGMLSTTDLQVTLLLDDQGEISPALTRRGLQKGKAKGAWAR